MIDPQIKLDTMKAGGNAVLGAGISAMTLNEWVALATLVYIILQAGLLVPKYWEIFKGRNRE